MRKTWLSLGAAIVGLAFWTAACHPSKIASFMEPVPKDEICMVQKYYMGPGKMTPVVLDNKTYYVCCQGCKDTITKDPNERWAIDPVSGKKVNKADAVLGKATNGQIHFFESEADRDAFRPTPTPLPDKD